MTIKHTFRFLLAAWLLLPIRSVAQFSIEKGDHTFEIGGNLITGYNYRFYQATETDFHKNNFILDEARFFFKGRVSTSLQYKFEMDLADLSADIQTPASAIGFLKDAYLDYHTDLFTLRAGYQKMPYCFNSMVAEIDDPFLQRPLIASKINSRRDLGVTLSHWFTHAGLNVLGGIYSGMGEEVFSTDNPNGKPEFLGRIEYSYPGRSIDQIIDIHDAPIPMFQFGVNARYKEGTITSPDDYNLMFVAGKKTSYGIDASVFYKGLSLQFEAHRIHLIPSDSTRLYSEGKQYTYLNAGGYLAELNYFFRPIKSVIAVRYDELNPSDLTYGNTQRTIAFAYNYLVRQNYLCLKVQYEKHLEQKFPAHTIWKDNELRACIQMIFN